MHERVVQKMEHLVGVGEAVKPRRFRNRHGSPEQSRIHAGTIGIDGSMKLDWHPPDWRAPVHVMGLVLWRRDKVCCRERRRKNSRIRVTQENVDVEEVQWR